MLRFANFNPFNIFARLAMLLTAPEARVLSRLTRAHGGGPPYRPFPKRKHARAKSAVSIKRSARSKASRRSRRKRLRAGK